MIELFSTFVLPFLTFLGTYIIPFLVVLTVLVFVHEYGHYWVARRCGVKVDVFSVGFGPELFGWNDRAGTRWRVSGVPLGGYVKMFGDAGPASNPDDHVAEMDAEERAKSFHHKTVGQRAAIVAAGPIANFLFAIIALSIVFWAAGNPFPSATIGDVVAESAAEEAGLLPGDRILSINENRISRFVEIAARIQQSETDAITLMIEREGDELPFEIMPRVMEFELADGSVIDRRVLGITAADERMSIPAALGMGVSETVSLGAETLTALVAVATTEEGRENIGGPIRIGQASGSFAQYGWDSFIWFMAVLSVNLGLINLLPIPMLDGGHLIFYATEAVRGRPLSERAQEYGFRIGLALVLTLMIFATWNDLDQLGIVAGILEFF